MAQLQFTDFAVFGGHWQSVFFSTSSGLFYGNGLTQLGIQSVGVMAVGFWTMACLSISSMGH
nr:MULTISPECIES: hypothetical protein [Clostridia]